MNEDIVKCIMHGYNSPAIVTLWISAPEWLRVLYDSNCQREDKLGFSRKCCG